MSQDGTEPHRRTAASSRRVVIVGGGTAGHVYPALAVAEAYRAAADVDLLFLGARGGFEARLVPRAGYRFELISAAPFFGVGLAGKVRTGWSLLRGVVEARRLLRAHRTELVIGFGGYASAGAVLAGWTLGLRTVVHEANVLPGRTNRFLARFVDRVYLGFEEGAAAFRSGRTRTIGIPVRSEIVRLAGEERVAPRIGERPVRVLVTGGSQGARFLNRHAPELLGEIGRRGIAVAAWQQVGDADAEPVRAAYAAAGTAARVEAYIDDMAGAYRSADFAITRAGACSIAELALAGLPALLVPLPTASDDHQTANAIAVAKLGAATWVAESKWHVEPLAAEIARLLSDQDLYHTASERMRSLARPEAAAALVRDCEEMLGRD